MTEDLNILWLEHAEWSRATFGSDGIRGPVGPMRHLAKEAIEYLSAPDDPMEAADVILLTMDAARRAGLSYGEWFAVMAAFGFMHTKEDWKKSDRDNIARICRQKLEINKARKWGKASDTEPVFHVKECAEAEKLIGVPVTRVDGTAYSAGHEEEDKRDFDARKYLEEPERWDQCD